MKTLIGPKMAAVLFVALAALVGFHLRGRLLWLALAIIGLLAVKSYLDYLRRRLE